MRVNVFLFVFNRCLDNLKWFFNNSNWIAVSSPFYFPPGSGISIRLRL